MSVIHKGVKIASNAVTGDTLPIGTIVDYDGTIVPFGYEEVLTNQYSETVLYDNAAGTTGTVTLSETSANFDYIEVFYKDEGSNFSSVKAHSPNGKKVSLQTMKCAIGSIQFYVKLASISGTSITPDANGGYTQIFTNGASAGYNNSANYILITRVVGYKEV